MSEHIAHLRIIDAVYCPKTDSIISIVLCKWGKNYTKCPFYVKGDSEKHEILCSFPFVKVNGKWKEVELKGYHDVDEFYKE